MKINNILDIVIVNWNSGDLLKRCVASIQSANIAVPGKLIVVDNGSSDNSVEPIMSMRGVQLIKPESNLGFGGGCNRGAAQGKAPFIIFLNPDIRFDPDTLEKLTSFITSDRLADDIGIIGVQLIGKDGQVQKNIASFPRYHYLFPRMLGLDRAFPGCFPPHFKKDIDYDRTQVVDQVPGAFFLVRRELFERLDGFDEQFFMYYEDVDFSYRARLAGWNTLYIAEIPVQHMGGGTTEQIKDRRLFYSLRSRVVYIGKHFGHMRAFVLIIGILILEFPARLIRALLHFSFDELSAITKALGLFIVNLPEVIRKL